MQTVEIGETVPVLSYWWNEDREGAEPSAITLTITHPDGTTTVKAKADLTSVNLAPAVRDTWLWPLTIDADGVWRYTYSGIVDGRTVEQSGMLLAGTDLSRTPGPCEPWATWDDVMAVCPTPDLSGIDTGVREQLLDRATWILYSLDGSRYPGICQTTRRICRSCVSCTLPVCRCGPRGAIDLGSMWPVYGVWDVTIDGVVLPPSAYQVRGRRYLDRLDGEAWPTSSDLTDPDAFTISWAYGRRPPVGLRDATAMFAAEMAKSCIGVKCELPARVTSITREGVSYVMLDSQSFIDQGRTGLYLVDLALAAARQGRKASPGGHIPLTSSTSASV